MDDPGTLVLRRWSRGRLVGVRKSPTDRSYGCRPTARTAVEECVCMTPTAALMKLGMPINYAGDFRETIDHLADFERAGVGRVTVPEAYSFDAVSQLGYIAARTEKMELQTGILPMFSRTPTNLAITAAGLDYISGGRAILGIGASGPQVIEGFHGVPYNAPLGRAREHVEICRKVWRREPVTFDGKHYHLPLGPEHGGSGLGKALKIINHPVRDRIPMLLAAIGPKNTELAAELFEEFQPFLFHPGYVDAAFGRLSGPARPSAAGPPAATHRGQRRRADHRRRRADRACQPTRPQSLRAVHRRHGRPRQELLQLTGRALRIRRRGQADPGSVSGR